MLKRTHSGPVKQPRRRIHSGEVLIYMLCLSSLGPYLVSSVRTEQLVIYGATVLSLPIAMFGLKRLIGLPIIGPWSAISLIAILSFTLGVGNTVPIPAGSILAGLDALLLPVATMIVIWCHVPSNLAIKALQITARLVVALGCINSLLAIASVKIDLSPILRFFWISDPTLESVADRAATMGRYSGIFNQPAEAGLYYSLALLLAIYTYNHRPVLLSVVILILAIGSFLTVSKIAIFIGAPIAAIYALSVFGFRKSFAYFVAGLATLFAILTFSPLAQWSGRDYLFRFMNVSGNDDLLTTLSAGRFGSSGSSLASVLEPIWAQSPLIGVGISGLAVAYDSGWVEIVVYAGIIGVVCMVLLHIVLLWYILQLRSLRSLYLSIWVCIIFANTGISAFTANRVSTLVWVLIALMALIACDERPASGHKYERRTEVAFPETAKS